MSTRKSSKSKRNRRNRKPVKEEVEEPFNPNPDLKDVVYDDECTVKVITPIVFTETGDIVKSTKTESKKTKSETKKTEKKPEKKQEKPEIKPSKMSPLDFKDVEIIIISVGPKKGHPWQQKITGQTCLYANKAPGATLNLIRGKKYLFKFMGKEAGYELVLTRSEIGGNSASCLEGTLPIAIAKDGLVTLNGKCPNTIYYQDKNKEYLGGIINVR